MGQLHTKASALYALFVMALAEGMAERSPSAGFWAATRGQSNLSGLFIGILVATIVGVAVAIPVINDVLADANLTGTTATVVGLIPLFIGLMLLVAIAAPLMRRVG